MGRSILSQKYQSLLKLQGCPQQKQPYMSPEQWRSGESSSYYQNITTESWGSISSIINIQVNTSLL